MYYLVFGLLYIVSLLPWRILYALSDLAYGIVYHLVGYRKKVITDNLFYAFPEKTEQERNLIAKKFYKCFCDNWVETLKLLSVSKKSLNKRTSGNFTVLFELYKTGKAVQGNFGHFFNWEILNLYMGIAQPYTFLSVYFPQKSKVMDRLMRYVRSRWGNPLVPTPDMARAIIPWRKKQYCIALGGDQSATQPALSYWLNFMNRPTSFVKGPEKYARGQNIPIVVTTTTRSKRGHYYFNFSLLADAEEIGKLPDGELMRRYVKHLEDNIRLQPELYLWSHRRWKHPWKAEYAKLWIDGVPAPK
jgi:KDO2-lipid IV(A) lauroyltransferase